MALTFDAAAAPDFSAFLKDRAGGRPSLDLLVKGARCAGCLAKIERETLALPGVDPSRWGSEQLNMVGPDDVDKVERIAEQLGRIDYVVESSPRIWATVGRMPARFPSSIRFFDALDSGALGFERVATFTSRPRLGPFEIDDSRAVQSSGLADDRWIIGEHEQLKRPAGRILEVGGE